MRARDMSHMTGSCHTRQLTKAPLCGAPGWPSDQNCGLFQGPERAVFLELESKEVLLVGIR